MSAPSLLSLPFSEDREPRAGIWLAAAADSDGEGTGKRFGKATRIESIEMVERSRLSTEDAALLTRLRADDETALRDLMRMYTAEVARIAYHYLRSEDLAYDVAQEIFIAVWERRHVLDGRSAFAHYLRRAARNRALNVLKQHSAQRRLSERVSDDAVMPRYAENVGFAATRAAEVDAAIRNIVATLTPRVRDVLLLYYERGLEPGEIAALLGVAPRTVYGQLRTAFRALARALTAYEDDT